MSHRIQNLLLAFVVAIVVVGSGALEDWFGRYYYGSDGVAYLDMSKAISRGDWTLALNPYWSIGYPTILSATRWMFSSDFRGEWIAVHVVNLMIFVATYVSFLYFLKVATIYATKVYGAEPADNGNGWNGFVFVIGTSLFLLLQLLVRDVSRIGPDLSVGCVFFLVMAISLQFCLRPQATTAVFMGVLMGFGYILKAILLPISAAVFLTVLLHSVTRLRAERLPATFKLAWALPAMALVAVPYIAAMSTVLGTFTLGEAGSLNYAWNVNDLPHWDHWQGGPAPFGTPIHPTQLLLKNPPVFGFAEPFHVTYPPWFNSFYWYEGYHRYFNIRNQISNMKSNLSLMQELYFGGPRALAAFLLFIIGLLFLKNRRIWWNRLIALWPLYLPSIAAICIYLMVFIEARYLVGFLTILFTTLLLPFFVPTLLFPKRVGYALAILIAVGSAMIIPENQKELIRRIIRHEPYANQEQWRVGLYLAESGFRAGDKVASVKVGNGALCSWAYMDGLQIVAEIGNDAFDPKDQEKDFELFNHSPEVQQTVLDLFRQAGAVLVVVFDVDGAPQGPGWERIPGTQSWVHLLNGNTRT